MKPSFPCYKLEGAVDDRPQALPAQRLQQRRVVLAMAGARRAARRHRAGGPL